MNEDKMGALFSQRKSIASEMEALRMQLDEERAKAIGFGPERVGKKDDAGKQRWYAMPLCVLKDLADAFNHGQKIYGLFNCLKEFENPKEQFWNALMRHLDECQVDPMSKDKESGCYNAACVAFNALMYLYHCKKGVK